MKKVLFLGHIPPPNHGAAAVGQMVLEYLFKNFLVKTIRISNSKSINDLGKVRRGHLLFFIKIIFMFLYNLIVFRPRIIYLTPSLNGKACFRDIVFLLIANFYILFVSAKVVLHVHMRPTYLNERKTLKFCWDLLTRKLEIILLSKNLINDFSASFKPKKLHIVPNTMYSVRICGPIDTHKSYEKIVLYLGHMLKSKGAFRLLKEVHNFEQDIKFIFAGEFGNEEDKLEFFRIADSLPNGQVRYVGVVNGKEKEILFNKADVLAIPSFSEALPLTMIEAFSCGLPIVATNVGGIVDYLDSKSGHVGEFEGFSSGLYDVLSMGKAYYSESCISIYNKYFTKECFEKKLEIIFEVVNE